MTRMTAHEVEMAHARSAAGHSSRARSWHARCYVWHMDYTLSRLLTVSALGVLSGVLAVTACTHTSDRVVEPVGGGDASTPSPELADSGVSPIGPIAEP